MLVDHHISIEALGFDEHEVQQAVEKQVIDLGHLAIHLQPQVVDDGFVWTVFQVAVDVERRITLTLNATPHTRQLFIKPFLLMRIECCRLLQFCQQSEAFGLVIGLLDDHLSFTFATSAEGLRLTHEPLFWACVRTRSG